MPQWYIHFIVLLSTLPFLFLDIVQQLSMVSFLPLLFPHSFVSFLHQDDVEAEMQHEDLKQQQEVFLLKNVHQNHLDLKS